MSHRREAERLSADDANERYLPGVELPRDLNIRTFGTRDDQFFRPDLVFLAVPSKQMSEAVAQLVRLDVSERVGIVSLAKGLLPPDGSSPFGLLERTFGPPRVACVGGPAHAREMVETGAGLVCASRSARRWRRSTPSGCSRTRSSATGSRPL